MKPLTEYTQEELHTFHASMENQFFLNGKETDGYVIIDHEPRSSTQDSLAYHVIVHHPSLNKYFAYDYKVRDVDWDLTLSVDDVHEVEPYETFKKVIEFKIVN